MRKVIVLWSASLFAILTLISGCNKGFVIQEPPDAITVPDYMLGEPLTLENLEAINDNQLQIIYSPETQQVKEIMGVFSNHSIFNEQDAVIALGSIRNIMNISDFSFSCRLVDERDNSTVYLLDQMYNGIPVMGYGFRVGAHKDGTPLFISGAYRNEIDINIEPIYSAKECATVLSLSTFDQIISTELTIYVYSGEEYLCWKYQVKSKDPIRNKTVFCDSNTRKIIEIISDSVT